MEPINIKIRNYRNFYPSPVEFEVKEGITFVLGLNNIGKSNILRFFYETRNILQNIAGQTKFPGTQNFDKLIKNKNNYD